MTGSIADPTPALAHRRALFLIPPTGAYCREDRCQSYFRFELIPSMRPPMEECEAAGALRSAGATPFIVDAPAERLDEAATLRRLREIGPDLVVLVVTFGSLDADLAWAARVRAELPGAAIGVRGAPCYVMAETILERAPAVDFCARGDYEPVFETIARDGYRAAPGTVFRHGPAGAIQAPSPGPVAADLDALPRPDRGAIDPRRYRVRGLGVPQATVHVQRGCPFPCSYCLVHTVSGAAARHRSPESVAEEMAEVAAGGVTHFYLRAETFTLDRAWARATSAAIAARCPQARWVTTTRVECADDATLAAMRRGGCYGISFGIDVGSEAIGRRVGKRPDLARARAAMRGCDRHGIVSLGYVMIGFLWDTPQTLAETARFMRAARPDLLTVHFAHPYPGTRYHAEVARHGVAGGAPHAQAEPALAATAGGVGRKALRRWGRWMLVRHYADPRVLVSLAGKLSRLLRAAPAPGAVQPHVTAEEAVSEVRLP